MRRLNLTRLNLSQHRQDAVFPGDRCPVEQCGGTISVYCTKRTASSATRYMKCPQCGFLPENKIVELLPVGTTT